MDIKEIYFPTIDSTNTYLKEHYLELDSFSIVRSDYQSAGHGRENRTWYSPKGENLLFSILIKDSKLIECGGLLSLVAACSICGSINKYSHNKLCSLIKWPNDIYINDKKVCGILLEGNVPNYIIIGIGLNINQRVFSDEYRVPPTSLSLLLNDDVDFESIKNIIYQDLANNLANVDKHRDEFLKYYREHDYLKGKSIEITVNHKMIKGVVKDIDQSFNLIITDENNNEHIISSGEIML